MESESLIQDGGSSQIKEINQQPHNIIETIILKDDDQSEGAVTLAANHDLETLLFAASLPLPCSNPASPTSETFFSTVTPRDLEQPNHSVSIDEQPSCSVVVVPTIAQEDQLIELPEVTQPSTEYVKRTELSLELSDRIEDLVPNNGELVREDLYQSSPGGEVAPTSVCVEDIPDLLEFAEQTGCIDELSLYNQQAELLDSEGLQIQLENHNNDANLDFINKIHSNLSSKIEVVNNLAISEPEEKEEEKETVDQESVPDINQISIEAFVTSLEPPHVLITLPPLPLSESLLEDPLSKCCNLTESTSSQGLVVETLYQMYPFAMKRWHCQPKLSILTAASFWSTYRVLETKNDL
ncbi:hypothetical protein BGZ46_007460 [Entomortierella lignicola]|nr:hypothetical protein BGZ46_007460 [Entomortierella lignicola]